MKIRRTLSAALFFCMFPAGCDLAPDTQYRQAAQLTRGDPQLGRQAIRDEGCISCHTLSSVPGARGLVGPPLDGIADRSYLAGEVPNTPENMVLWIQHPHQVEPNTVMPEMGLSEQQSRNIAAYLLTQHTAD